MAKKKILFIRLDKIGDLICTLPVDQVLDPKIYDITWVVQKGLGQILDFGEKNRQYIELDKNNRKQAQLKLNLFLASHHFDTAISFQCPWWVNWEIFKAQIRQRIGVLSQWHSFLFLNKGLRQKRSQAQQHEFAYNLELVEKITGPLPEEKKQNLFFKFKKPSDSKTLERFKITQPSYIVVHPGMMGSALNWSQLQYIEYINELLQQKRTVVITGTAADEPYLTDIKAAFEKHPQVHWLQSKLNMRELLEILNYAEKVIAPSTGVLHLAASLDKEVHGIYSPIQVHHPRRWAARGPHVHTYLPTVDCPSQFSCLKNECPHYNCMDQIKIST